jgi:hypothetical protein
MVILFIEPTPPWLSRASDRRCAEIPQRPDRELGTIPNFEFAEDPTDEFLNRALRQVKAVSDLFVMHPISHELHDLFLAERETARCQLLPCADWGLPPPQIQPLV